MNAQGAAVAIRENLKIAASLSSFHNSESVFLPGYGEVGGIVAGDLQKHAGVWTALIGLSGGVQEARTEAQTRGHFLFVADRMTHRLQLSLVRVVALDVSKKAKI